MLLHWEQLSTWVIHYTTVQVTGLRGHNTTTWVLLCGERKDHSWQELRLMYSVLTCVLHLSSRWIMSCSSKLLLGITFILSITWLAISELQVQWKSLPILRLIGTALWTQSLGNFWIQLKRRLIKTSSLSRRNLCQAWRNRLSPSP